MLYMHSNFMSVGMQPSYHIRNAGGISKDAEYHDNHY